MYNIAKLNRKDRKALFDKYVLDYGSSPAIIEKDFWVSLMLDYLFNKCPYKKYFVFKGGTSLSKCYKLIDRFSEDIDLTIDHNYFDVSDKDLYGDQSNTARKKVVAKVKIKLAEFIVNKLKPCLEKDFKSFLIETPKFEIEKNDPSILNFYYPNVYEAKPAGLLQCIRLEIGAISELKPNEIKEVSPLISKIKTPIFKYKKFNVKTIMPIKTFWEKILILHQEANRPFTIIKVDQEVPYPMPKRYSRHYYDVWKISQSKYFEEAMNNYHLLNSIIKFKDMFYHYSWSDINSAKTGFIKLIPPETRLNELKNDFDSMKEMINDSDIKSFKDLINKLKQLELKINNKKPR